LVKLLEIHKCFITLCRECITLSKQAILSVQMTCPVFKLTLNAEEFDRPSIPRKESTLRHKRSYSFIVLSLVVGVLAVLTDVAIGALVFNYSTLWEAFFGISFYQQILRFQVFAAFVGSSLFMFKGLKDRRRAEGMLSALNRCGRSLNRAKNLNEIYELTLAFMELTLGFEYAAFMLVEGGRLVVSRSRGFAFSIPLELPLNGSKGGVTIRSIKQRKAILVSDIVDEPEYVEPGSHSPRMRSEIAVPIVIEDEALGVLNAESKKSKAFDENDLTMLQILASHAATAIANLNAQDQVRSYTDQLEAKVKQKTDELVATHDKLIKAQRLAAIGELAGMVGHDLRNPLTGIAGATYYLRVKYGDAMDKKGKDMLGIIEENIKYSDKIINDLLDYSREMKLELSDTDPKSLLKEILRTMDIPECIEIVDRTRKSPKIQVDLAKMHRVFKNLIKNAIDAMPSGGVLTIVSLQKNDKLTIQVKDTGKGMPPETMDKLWTPLFTTKAKGMGFGLPICKRIIEAHKGNILVESHVDKGTTFSVVLPSGTAVHGEQEIMFEMPRKLELGGT